jgi:hypothetical protein
LAHRVKTKSADRAGIVFRNFVDIRMNPRRMPGYPPGMQT